MSDSTKHTAGLTNEEKRDAVVTAALDWFSERAIKDWSEAYLAHAIISMEGDWPGCEGCDFECDEPCTPATESEQHHAIDCCIAQRVHDGKLVKPMDYEPPEGWKPIVMRPKRNIEAKISRLLDATQAERDTLRAEVALIKSHQDELLEVLAEMVVRFQNLRESNGLDRKSNLAKRAYELIAKAAEIAALKGGA
jgi:hypothetical protein